MIHPNESKMPEFADNTKKVDLLKYCLHAEIIPFYFFFFLMIIITGILLSCYRFADILIRTNVGIGYLDKIHDITVRD